MPWSKPKANRPKIVRKRLADGTIKEYQYDRTRALPSPVIADSLAMMIQAYQASPEWKRLAPATADRYIRYLRPLLPHAQFSARELTRKLVTTIRNQIVGTEKPAAANAFVRATSALYAWGMENDWVDTNPTFRIRPLAGGHFPAWTPAVAAQSLEILPEHLRRLVLLALYTGQRRADLCRLAWSNYDGARIRLIQGKTGTSLVIPVHPVLQMAMDGWERQATTILVNARGRPWKPGTASHGMKLAIDRLGLPKGWNIHGLRKLAAANLAEVGCSALEIAAITGHKSLAMLQLYTASADQERMATAAIVRLQTGRK
jgi:integrase